MTSCQQSYTTLSLLKYPKALYMVLLFLYRKLLAQSIEEKKWGLGGEKKERVTVTFPVKNPLNGSDMAVKVF